MKPTDIIESHFSFLATEYGFEQTDQSYDPEFFGNAGVNYVRNDIRIRIAIDRGQVLIDARRISQRADEWHDIGAIVRVYSPDVVDVYNFPQDITTQPQRPLDEQAEHLAAIIRIRCQPILQGNFPTEDEFLL